MFGFGRKKKETKKQKSAPKKTGAKTTARNSPVKKTAPRPQKRTVVRKTAPVDKMDAIKKSNTTARKTVTRTVNTGKRQKALGEVYWANSQKIDSTDQKPRRMYAVTRSKNKTVGVSKVRGYNNNPKNETRLAELDQRKYKLKKRCGVDKKVYTRRADTKQPLSLKDKQVFDEKPAFKLNNRDTRRVIRHTRENKKGGSR